MKKLPESVKQKNILGNPRESIVFTQIRRADMARLMKPKPPLYDGNNFIPDEFHIPEEELICWSETSMLVPLNSAGCKRYQELFRQLLPDVAKKIFPEDRP